MHRLTGYMSRGLTQTANNHAKADHDSVIRGRFSVVPRQPSFRDQLLGYEVSGPLNLPAPPSAAGPGKNPGHSLLGSLTGIEVIDISKDWPTADPFVLLSAAMAWQNAHDALIEIRGRIAAEVHTVTGQGDAPDLEAFGGFWNKLYKPGAENTLYEGLPQLCASISKACGDYGTAVNNAQLQVNDAAANPIAALLEVAALRATLAQAAGRLLQTVSVIAGGALADQLITAINISVVNAPNVRIMQAATEGEDFDAVLREWQDPSSEAPSQENLESKQSKIARKLAGGYTEKEIDDAIHAVKGGDGWRGLGDNTNPDVAVDVKTGEVFPKTKDGIGESSIGNILDHLPPRGR
jgi:hypothetical protein